MYGIYLRSQKEPIFVDNTLGEKLRADWVASRLPRRVEIGSWTGEAEQIKAIQKDDTPAADDSRAKQLEDKMQDAVDYMREIDQEYWNDRLARMRQPISERAKNMRIPSLVWQAHTAQTSIPDNVKSEIEARQLAYLTENPTKSFANPIAYKDIIDNQPVQRRNTFSAALLRLAERQIQSDIAYSKKMFSY